MIMIRHVWLALVVAIAAAGCATQAIGPAPTAEQPDSSGIGLAIELRAPLGWPIYHAHNAYFIKLDGAAVSHPTEIIVSNYAKEGRIYLLNVPPGEYAVVAVYFTVKVLTGPVTSYATYFQRDLVELTRVRVKQGQFAFAGRYLVDMSANVCPGEADDIQLHYATVLSPGDLKCGFVAQVIKELATNSVVIGNRVYSRGGGSFHYRGSKLEASRDEMEMLRFFEQARSDLAEGGWASRLE